MVGSAQEGDGGRRGPVLAAAAAVFALAAGLAVDVQGRSDAELLAFFAPTLGLGLDWDRLGEGFLALRLPLLGACAASLTLSLWHGPAWNTARLLSAVGIACVGHSFLIRGPIAAGLFLYAVALAAWSWRRETPRRLDTPLRAAVEVPVFAGLMALAAGLVFHRLDVAPFLNFDEFSYMLAARRWLGELGPEDLPPYRLFSSYYFGRFRAQFFPLSLHALGVASFGPSILALRLVAAIAGLCALGVAYAALRRALGVRVALTALALCASAPLFLSAARYGHYISISILHAALTLNVLLVFLQRPTRPRAAALGALCGASLFFYQVSWFVPVLVALGLLVTWRSHGGSHRPAMLALAALAAGVVAVPATLALSRDVEWVLRRSVGQRTSWLPDAAALSGTETGLVARTAAPLDREAMSALVGEIRARGVAVRPLADRAGRTALAFAGDERAIRSELDRLGLDHRHVLVEAAPRGPATNLAGMMAELFYKPGIEFGLRLIDGPILNPLVAPFIVLGLAEALRRRREPAWRVVLVWALAGALLPAALVSVAPRRAVLMLPWIYGLAALPLLELQARARPRGRAGAAVSGALAGAALLAVTGLGSHLWFEGRSDDLQVVHTADPARAAAQTGVPRRVEGSVLELAKLLRGVPGRWTVVVAPLHTHLAPYLGFVERRFEPGAERRLRVDARASDPAAIRDVSCRWKLPLTWIQAADDPDPSPALADAFRFRTEVRGPYRVLHIQRRDERACG